MTTSSTVRTVLYIAADGWCPSRNVNLVFRVGTTHGPMTNAVCVASPIQYTGWYQCATPLTGLHFSVNEASTPLDYFHTAEILAYSEYSVQKNVLSVAMSSVAAGSNKDNVLKMGYIDAWNGTSTACATTNSEINSYISMRFKA